MSKKGSNLRGVGNCKVSSLKKLTSAILLMLYGSTLTVTPLAIAATNISKQTTLVPYNVVAGDTVFSLAKKHGLKPDQLVQLNKNAPNPIPHDFSIKVGQVIYVPNGKVIELPELGGLQTKPSESAGFIDLEKFVAQQAMRQGNNFSSNDKSNDYSQAITQGGAQANPQDSYNQWLQQNGGEPQDFNDKKYTSEDEKRYWQQQVSSTASQVSQDFIRDNLSGFGTVKTELIFDEDFNITNFGLDVLAPLHDTESRLAFAQVGVHHLDSTNKTTVNLGLGQRHFFDQWMFGYNAFFDTTLSNAENDSHQRLGLGIESWADFFKFGINYYTPLSGWKDSQLFDNYEERAAKGFDVRLDYYLPSYPQLGLNAKYEQYFGDEVDIMGNKQRQRDPYSATVGVEWQPIPLVSFNVDHTEAKGGQSNTQGTVNLEWKMGASLNDMLDPDKVAGKRSLKGMRYDLVERNNNIVLEYREKQSSIEISHATISGMSGDKVTLSPEVKISGKAEITHWEWYSPDEKIQQGLSFALSQNPELTLPELALDFEGIYESSIFLKVTDSHGKVHYSAAIPIAVLVNPNAYVKRISIPALGVDSKENPTTELTIEDQHIDVHWYFVRQHKTDAQQYAVVKAETVDIKVPDGYEVEAFDGEYISGQWNGNEISNVWRNHLRIKPTAIQTNDSKTKSVLPVVQLTAIGQGGAHVETVSFYLKSAEAIDPNAKPQVSNLRMAGKLEVGQALTATYAFDANGGDANDQSTYAWGNEGETAAAVPAGQTVTNSGEVPSYALVTADIGEVKEVSVQAKNGLAVTGNTVTVDSSMGIADGNDTTGGTDTDNDGKGDTVIDPAGVPVVSNLRMAGKLEVGESLTATYAFDANGGDANDQSTYAWGNEGETAAAVPAGQTVTTSGVVPAHTLVTADIGEVKEVSVQAKNGLAVTGNTVTVDAKGNASDSNGGTGGGSNDTTGGTDTDNDGKGDTVIDPAGVPVVSNLRMAGKLEVGESLTATYAFNANGGDANDKSTYAWGNEGETAAAVPAGQTVTNSGEVPSYALVTADIGEVKEVSVQAKNGLAVTGNTVTVDSSMGIADGNDTTGGTDTDNDGKGDTVIDPAAGPQVSNLRMAGKLEVGQALTATYAFDANGGDANDQSTYAWGNEGETAAAVPAGQTVANSGVVPGHTLVTADIGEVKEVSVQAKNGLAVTGNTVTVDSSMGIADGNDTTGGTDTDNDGKGDTVIDPAGVPVVSNLRMAGKLEVGQALTATYAFDANGGDANDQSTYAWGNEGETAAAVPAGQTVTNSGEVPSYALVTADIGEVKEVSVQAKNGLAVTGNTVTVDAKGNASDSNGGTGGGSNDTTGGTDTDNDGKGDTVIDPAGVPVVSNLRMAGKLEVGQALTATYAFDANGGDANDKSTYAWGNEGETAAAVPAGQTVTNSGEVPSYALVTADIGEVKEVSVQAKNGLAVTGNTVTVDAKGNASDSNGGTGGGSNDTTGGTDTDNDGKGDTVIDPAAGPQVSNLRMAGKLEVGESLTATYAFDANGGDANDKSTYAWGNEGETAAAVPAGQTVTNSGEVPSYALVTADIGEVKEVSVQAKNGLAVTGNTVTVDSSMGIADGNDTTGGTDTDGDGKGDTVIDPAAGPQVSNLRMAGKLEVGESLTATYAFNANGGDANDKSTYAWGNEGETAAAVPAGQTVTNSGEVPSYALVTADIGEVKEVSVQAKNGLAVTGNTVTVDAKGNASDSNGGTGGGSNDTTGGTDTDNDGKGDTVIDPAGVPVVSNLRMAGKLEVGQALTATYAFDANGGDANDKSTYAWGNEGETAAAVPAGQTVTNSGEVPSYALVTADIGEVKEVSVQAKNGLAVTGNTVTVDAKGNASDSNGGTGGGSNDTTGGTDTDNDGNGDTVIDPAGVPVVSNLRMAGKLEVGQALTATYAFDANGGDANDQSTYAWGNEGETAAAVPAGQTVTNSGEVPSYALVTADIGEVKEVSVQAKNGLAVTGNTVTVDSSMGIADGNDTTGGTDTDNDGKGDTVIDPAGVPVVSNLRMAGKLEVGQALTATYAFDANGGDANDQSTYAWGNEGETAAAVPAGQTVTNSGEVPSYALVTADIGEVKEVSVQAKNGLAVTGNTVTVDSSMGIADGNDTTGGTDTDNDGKGDTVIDPAGVPVVSNLRMAGKLEVGQALTATYAFDANGGDANDQSTYAWGNEGETAAAVPAGQTVTTSGVVPAHTLVTADIGEVKEVSVQAKNGLAVTGNTVTVDSSMGIADGNDTTGGTDTDNDGKGDTVIDPAGKPVVSNLRMAGKLEVGQALTATYAFDANGGDANDQSTYAWGNEGETAAAVPAGQTVTNSGVVPAHTLVTADIGEVKEVSVQAKNGLAVTGNTVTVDSSMGIADGNDTTGGTDTDNDGKGDTVIDPSNISVLVDFNSTATLGDNGVDGIRPVVKKDEMTAKCQIAGEAQFTVCDNRFDLQWHVGGTPVAGETASTFTAKREHQGQTVQVKATLKP